MKLKDCTYGKLVTDGKRVGMIKGITNKAEFSDTKTRDKIENAIPLIEWASGHVCGIHHGNIEIFKG